MSEPSTENSGAAQPQPEPEQPLATPPPEPVPPPSFYLTEGEQWWQVKTGEITTDKPKKRLGR